MNMKKSLAGIGLGLGLALVFSSSVRGQEKEADRLENAGKVMQETQPSGANAQKELSVNWLYGAYVPKDVPLVPLTPKQRWKLYIRMTYTTWGIYIKTGFFTMSDQIRDTPPEWERSASGFAKRAGTRQAQFVIQNSLTALGDAALGWEVRYNRCRCEGFKRRSWHAIARNFVTYRSSDQHLRPQIMPYAAAFAASVTAASWEPGNPNLLVKGYQGAITQVAFGIGVNWLAEFAPDIKAILRRNKGGSDSLLIETPPRGLQPPR
jgi:hypothetical protein